ncbi:unnamed protein product [Absidia cylindrospora]
MLNILQPQLSPRIYYSGLTSRLHYLQRNTALYSRRYRSFTSNSNCTNTTTSTKSPIPQPNTPLSSSSSSSSSSSIPISHSTSTSASKTASSPSDIQPWKHYIAPTLFALVTIGGSFLVAASSYERQETFLFRRTQYRRELLRRKLRNDSVDKDTFEAYEWRRHHDDKYRKQQQDEEGQEKKENTDEDVSTIQQKRQLQLLQQLQKQQEEREDPERHGGLDRSLGMIKSWMKYQWYQCEQLYQALLSPSTLSPSHRTVGCLIGLNILVFAGWRLLPLKCQPFMTRWFTNHPTWCVGPRNLTLITASFSHQHLLPLAINMTALWYFGTTLHDILGQQQFLAFYLSSAVTATTVSRWLSLFTRKYRPLLLLPSATSTGASGAIYSGLAALTVLHPSSTVDFIPWVPVQLNVALPGLLTLDLTGILFRWRLFDHYSHIGGAGFGLWYMAYGQEKMWIPLVRKIRDIRDRNERNGRNGSGPPTTSIDIPTQLPWIRRVNKEG